jgi:predicted LPLAT superfamily acyltransferase
MDTPKAQWDARSHGGYWGHWFFHQVTKRLGIRFAYLWLYPVVAYYTLKASTERASSLVYLDRLLGPATGWARWKRAYWHFYAFARTMLDGAVLGAHGPGAFTCVHDGLEHIRAAAREKQGLVLLTGHLGNWEVASGLLEGQLDGANVAVVMFRGDEERLQTYVEAIRGKRPRLIAVGEGSFSSLEILHALRDGTVVAMPGDRTVDARDVTVPFLGHPARWPIGPWVVAAVSGAPVVFTFALQTGPCSYHFIADPPRRVAFNRARPKDEQLREWVSEYVARVEALLRQHPYQWFNFFDFWAAQPKLPAAGPTVRSVSTRP